jgi:glutamine amidotransferase
VTGTVPVVLVDYGVGNVLSVRRALEASGGDVLLTSDVDCVRSAERLVVPGVGAFADCVAGLTSRGLADPVLEHARSGRPLLGICVGMQMLFEVGEEFGEHRGLGLLAGRVQRIPDVDEQGARRKVPHIGWNALDVAPGADWSDTLLRHVRPREAAYFVHSYSAVPADDAVRLADVDYAGYRVSAAVSRGNIFGCQFHPEKSADVGLRVMRSFLEVSSNSESGGPV